MTTEQIRKCIRITHYYKDRKGLSIAYDWSTSPDIEWENAQIFLNPQETLEALNAWGEINLYGTEIEYNEVIFDTWLDFIEKWVFSQWDALNLVIRHEYTKSLESDVNMLEIDSALKALKNS